MPDPKKQSKKNKLKKKYQGENLKRGERRPDGSIVGGIAGTKKPTATKGKKQAATKAEKQAATKPPQKAATKAKKQTANSSKFSRGKKGVAKKASEFKNTNTNTIDKTTGKKYDDSEQGRKDRLKREQAAGMRDEMGYQTSTYENGPAPKNLGTVSDGTPFYKRGPLYAHGPNGTHPTDPTKEAKAKAEAKNKAEANASKGKKVYGKSTTKVEKILTPGGNVRGTKTTTTTPYTRSGTGSAKFNTAYRAAKKAKLGTFDYGGKTIKVEDAASRSGKDVSSTTKWNKLPTVPLKPVGIQFTPLVPTADITIPKVPKKSKPPMPTFSMSKGRSGGGTTKLIDFNNNRVKKTKSRSGNSCGCG